LFVFALGVLTHYLVSSKAPSFAERNRCVDAAISYVGCERGDPSCRREHIYALGISQSSCLVQRIHKNGIALEDPYTGVAAAPTAYFTGIDTLSATLGVPIPPITAAHLKYGGRYADHYDVKPLLKETSANPKLETGTVKLEHNGSTRLFDATNATNFEAQKRVLKRLNSWSGR
jgi:hypothetical protein